MLCIASLLFILCRIRLRYIGQPKQIICAGVIDMRQFYQDFYRYGIDAILIGGIRPAVDVEHICELLLCPVSILPQRSNTVCHDNSPRSYHSVPQILPLTFGRICGIVFYEVKSRTYKILYLRLVAAIDDALMLLEAGKIVSAIELLKKALVRAEEAHMETDIIPEK